MRFGNILVVIFILISIMNAYPVERWIYTETLGSTNYDFGKAFGEKFSQEIRTRLEEDLDLKLLVSQFGKETQNPLFSYFIETHEKVFPNYMEELQGISDGSGAPFDVLFISQLKQEFTYYLNKSKERDEMLLNEDHCSDVVLSAENGDVWIAHNEDAGIYDVNSTVLIEAVNGVNGGPGFTALVYLGQTPTNAFGFNSNGVVFTMNKVPPMFPDIKGVGRVFIGRSLLDSLSFDDAVNKATEELSMIAGHNYQIGLAGTNQIVNVEVASFGEYKITKFPSGDEVFFHANMYTMLDVPQILPNPSSEHRIARFNDIQESNPIKTPNDMLDVLGDQADNEYPIYHDAKSHSNGDLSGYTLVSILINVRTCEMLVYEENPKLNQFAFKLIFCYMPQVKIDIL